MYYKQTLNNVLLPSGLASKRKGNGYWLEMVMARKIMTLVRTLGVPLGGTRRVGGLLGVAQPRCPPVSERIIKLWYRSNNGIMDYCSVLRLSPMDQMVKNPPAMQEP